MTPEIRDTTRGVLSRAVLITAGFLALLGTVLYAVFWLPFRNLDNPLPHAVRILPTEPEPSSLAIKESQEPKYAWVDRDKGIVRIPIKEAMNLVIETLPISKEAMKAAKEREQRIIPTDAGSGRFVKRPGEPRA